MKIRMVSVAIGALTLIGPLGVWLAPTASASCAGPSIEVSPSQVPKGAKTTITGTFFLDRCNDVATCMVFTPLPSPGNPSPQQTQTCSFGDPAVGLKNIRIEFKQGGRVWSLGTVDADAKGQFRLEAEVPSDADFGSAQIITCPYPSDPECGYPFAELRVVGVVAAPGGDRRGMMTAGIMVLAAAAAMVALTRFARSSL